jgi:hypothetical protein
MEEGRRIAALLPHFLTVLRMLMASLVQSRILGKQFI